MSKRKQLFLKDKFPYQLVDFIFILFIRRYIPGLLNCCVKLHIYRLQKCNSRTVTVMLYCSSSVPSSQGSTAKSPDYRGREVTDVSTREDHETGPFTFVIHLHPVVGRNICGILHILLFCPGHMGREEEMARREREAAWLERTL